MASGVAALTKDLKAAVDECPEQKVVLLGYSQGGEFLQFPLGEFPRRRWIEGSGDTDRYWLCETDF